MKTFNLVDENGKEVKIDETNVNEFIIRNAVEITKQSLPKHVGFIPNGMGANIEPCTMDQFTNNVLNRYRENGVFDRESNISEEKRTTAFATMRAAQIVYNMCVEQEIKDNIGRLFKESEVGKKLQPKVYEDSIKKVEETFNRMNNAGINKEFVDSIHIAFRGNAKNRNQNFRFLDQSLRYVDEVSKNLLNDQYDFEEALYAGRTENALNSDLTKMIHGAVSEYMEPLKNSVHFGFSYVEGDIKPHEFLEKFRKDPENFADNLTPQEKEWVTNTYRHLEDRIAGQQFANQAGTDRVDLTDFKVDGVQIISDDEAKIESDSPKNEAKIIANILSGKQVTSQSKDSKNSPIEINPTIVYDKPEGILDWIIDILKKFISFETEKDKVQAMSDSFDKKKEEENLKTERQKMGFNDLMENTFDKVTTARQKEKDENVVQISSPTMKR